MARQNKPAPRDAWQKIFVNVPLSEEDKKAIKEWQMDGAELDSKTLKLMEEGHRVTLSYDSFNQCYSATLSQVDEKHPNSPFLLAGKGSSPLKSLRQAMYIHWKLLDGDWKAYSENRVRQEIDD